MLIDFIRVLALKSCQRLGSYLNHLLSAVPGATFLGPQIDRRARLRNPARLRAIDWYAPSSELCDSYARLAYVFGNDSLAHGPSFKRLRDKILDNCAGVRLQRRTVLLLRSPLAVHQSTEAPSDSPIKAAPSGVNTETASGVVCVSSGKTRTIWLSVPVRLSCTSTHEWTATTFVGSWSSGTMVAR
jgi:hypothetical protein